MSVIVQVDMHSMHTSRTLLTDGLDEGLRGGVPIKALLFPIHACTHLHGLLLPKKVCARKHYAHTRQHRRGCARVHAHGARAQPSCTRMSTFPSSAIWACHFIDRCFTCRTHTATMAATTRTPTGKPTASGNTHAVVLPCPASFTAAPLTSASTCWLTSG